MDPLGQPSICVLELTDEVLIAPCMDWSKSILATSSEQIAQLPHIFEPTERSLGKLTEEAAGTEFDKAFVKLGDDPYLMSVNRSPSPIAIGPISPSPIDNGTPDFYEGLDIRALSSEFNEFCSGESENTCLSDSNTQFNFPSTMQNHADNHDIANTSVANPSVVNHSGTNHSVANNTPDTHNTAYPTVAIHNVITNSVATPGVVNPGVAKHSVASYNVDSPGYTVHNGSASDKNLNCVSHISTVTPGPLMCFSMETAKSRSRVDKSLPKPTSKQAPKKKQDDILHGTRTNSNRAKKNTNRTRKKNNPPAAPKTPVKPETVFPSSQLPTPATGKTIYAAPTFIDEQQRLLIRDQLLRTQWHHLQMQRNSIKRQQPTDKHQVICHKQKLQWLQDTLDLHKAAAHVHNQEVQRFKNTQKLSAANGTPTKQSVKSEISHKQQLPPGAVQQTVQQVPAVHSDTIYRGMQGMLPQTQQFPFIPVQQTVQQHTPTCNTTPTSHVAPGMLPNTPQFAFGPVQQAVQQMPPGHATPICPGAQAQQFLFAPVQQVVQQMPAVNVTPASQSMQGAFPQTPQFQPTSCHQAVQQVSTVDARMTYQAVQGTFPHTQQFPCVPVQQIGQPVPPVYATPPKERMQSIPSLSAGPRGKKSISFMDNVTPTDFKANPGNHARWSVSPDGGRTYLNRRNAKKARG